MVVIDKEYITGVKEKYPVSLLKGRIETEGNVISCFFKDMLLLDDTTFKKERFRNKRWKILFLYA